MRGTQLAKSAEDDWSGRSEASTVDQHVEDAAVASSDNVTARADKNYRQAVVQAKQYQLLASKQSILIQLVAQYLDQTNLDAGLLALTTEIHQQFSCARVVVGLAEAGVVKVVSISQQADFDPRSSEVALIQGAMQEACDQDELVYFSNDPDYVRHELLLVEAHRALVSGVRSAQICTVPMCYQGELIGCLTIEVHDADPWSPLTLDLFKQITRVSAPLVALRRSSELGLGAQLKRSAKNAATGLFGPRHLSAKLGTLALALVVLVASVVPVEHRLPANAQLISTEKRLISAPLNSFLDAVYVDVGDAVVAGQKLLSLDTKDFEIEVQRLDAAFKTAQGEYRSAMASYDRQAIAVAQAQLQQTSAELQLIKGQISRSQIVAPSDGIVISGDLAQMLGSPVDRGQTLLEIAPDTDYQIQLNVHESDVRFAKVGQRGTLALTSSPLDEIEFEVTGIHPIAVIADNATQFRLDAIPTENIVQLVRPGQTGIAKIEVGRQRLIWVWTHRFRDWMQLKLWSWFG